MKKISLLILFFTLSCIKVDASVFIGKVIDNNCLFLNDEDQNISSKVRSVLPKVGELSRWKVSLKKITENSEPNAKLNLAIQELSKNTDFINWWKGKINGWPNQMSLAVLEIIKPSDDSIVVEIAFLPYLEQATGVVAIDNGAAAIVFYDVNASAPIAMYNIAGSSVPLLVWHIDDLYKIKIKGDGFERAKDTNGRLIPINEVNPYNMRYKYGVDSIQK